MHPDVRTQVSVPAVPTKRGAPADAPAGSATPSAARAIPEADSLSLKPAFAQVPQLVLNDALMAQTGCSAW
jgi:hypothetical protein